MFTENFAYGTGYSANTNFRPMMATFARETGSGHETSKAGNEWFTQGGLVSVAAVSGIQSVIVQELKKVEAVSAIFCEQDLEEGVLRIFTVVAQHEPETYEEILRSEAEIDQRLRHLVTLDFRVRAHQGRQPRHVVPVGTNPIYVR